MKLGILSDTHDNLPKIRKAVKFFNQKKMDFVLHAGDFIAPFTVAELDRLSCPWQGVFGNNDGEKEGLAGKSKGRIKEGPLRIKLGQRKIILAHDQKSLDLKKEKAELVVCGHTHKPQIKKLGKKLLVNPGECSGWLFGQASIAWVELDSLKAEMIRI